jgi:hypothetical protein
MRTGSNNPSGLPGHFPGLACGHILGQDYGLTQGFVLNPVPGQIPSLDRGHDCSLLPGPIHRH